MNEEVVRPEKKLKFNFIFVVTCLSHQPFERAIHPVSTVRYTAVPGSKGKEFYEYEQSVLHEY